jgi:UDP-N-acetylglucosamine 1-carboxyvinyltransferase
MLAASLAEGTTIIENAAEEPEIVDLANFLNEMGADVKGAGTNTIKIKGVKSLKGAEHNVIPDRIEAATYMVAAAMTKGDITIENVIMEHLKPVTAKLIEAGCEVIEMENAVRVIGPEVLKSVDIKTLPHPGFPTDVQAQFMAMDAVANGTGVVIETVFENRFMHVAEFNRMGANIKIEGRSAIVTGVDKLYGSKVKATDLRAGAALILCGLIAEGETEIGDIYHIQRGYVDIDKKITALGGNIEIIED